MSKSTKSAKPVNAKQPKPAAKPTRKPLTIAEKRERAARLLAMKPSQRPHTSAAILELATRKNGATGIEIHKAQGFVDGSALSPYYARKIAATYGYQVRKTEAEDGSWRFKFV